MKPPEEISTRIIGNIEHMLKFPKMWFFEPKCMEGQLMYLTDLLSFIHEQPENQYGSYLVENGYQSNTFTNSIEENGHRNTDEVFSSFSEFFQEFFDLFKSTLTK
jgi:hypothetical protein